MPVTVYVWRAGSGRSKKSRGHASLYLRESNEYISFYPAEWKDAYRDLVSELPSATLNSYDDDLQIFEKPADRIIKLESFREEPIVQRWNDLKMKPYVTLGRNCSMVVLYLLEAALEDREASGDQRLSIRMMHPRLLWGVLRFYGRAFSGMATLLVSGKPNWLFDDDVIAAVTPADVEWYAGMWEAAGY